MLYSIQILAVPQLLSVTATILYIVYIYTVYMLYSIQTVAVRQLLSVATTIQYIVYILYSIQIVAMPQFLSVAATIQYIVYIYIYSVYAIQYTDSSCATATIFSYYYRVHST